MARKSKKEESIKIEFDPTKYDQHMKEQPICEMIDINYMPYAMSVIISRALADVRDGMKPSQRKTLYTMKNMNLYPGHKSKSANIAGTTLRLNPHSDQSCYETMVRMVDKNETLLAPYVAGKGSFGKHYSRDMAFAASRYCVTGDTLITTNNGIMKIKDLVLDNKLNEDYDIDILVKSFGGKTNKAIKFFNSGEHDTYTIKLENGQELTATPNHPILIMKDNTIVWKLFEDVEVGDCCIIDLDCRNQLFGDNNDILEAQTLGLMIAGGFTNTQTKLAINHKDEKLLMPVYEYFKRKNPDDYNEILYYKNHEYFEYGIKTKKDDDEFIEKYEYQVNAKGRHIPACVLKGTKEYQSNFLKYLYEIQGDVVEDSIKYYSYSLDLIKELQILLTQSFGILSNIERMNNGQFILNINGQYINKFKVDISFVSKEKNDKLNDLKINDKVNIGCIALPIISKQDAGKQVVYSVKVDSDCHSFSANGLINHNTEASLSALGMELFKGINKNAVDMVDNYDGTMKEPSVLPVAFPAILANPTLGVAVGFASNICSFNLKELCEATIERLKHPKSDLLDIMPCPDFTTGGYLIYNKEEMREIYNTGKGAFKIRAKYSIDKKQNRIEITEIPYSTTAEAIVDTVIDYCKKGKIKEINDIRDDTDKNGLMITIDYKRTCDPEQLMLKLFKLTTLEDSFNCNFNVIVDGAPKCLGVYAMLDEWIKFRKECIVRMLTFDLNQKQKELHLLEGLAKILVNIDKAIKIIKDTEKDELVVPNLMKAFKIDEVQAEYIANIKLRNINKEYILSRTKLIEDIKKEINTLEKQIKSDAEIKRIIIKDLQDIIKKFSIERKTQMVDCSEVDSIDEESVASYNVNIYITKQNYFKKIPVNLIKEDTEIKVKDDDEIKEIFVDNNLGDLLIFTNKTNVYKLKISELNDCRPQDFGNLLNTLAGLEEDEEIIFVHCTNDYSKELIIAFENGKVARIPIKAYETKTNRKMLKNGFFDGSKVVMMDVVDADETRYYMIKSTKDKVLVFANINVPLKTTKSTQGVQIFRLTKDAIIKECNTINITNKKQMTKYIPNNYPAAGR